MDQTMNRRAFLVVAIRFFGFYLLVVALRSAWALFLAFMAFSTYPPGLAETVPIHLFRMLKEAVQMGIPALFGLYMIIDGPSFYQQLRALLTDD
jgi:hypothetical protein